MQCDNVLEMWQTIKFLARVCTVDVPRANLSIMNVQRTNRNLVLPETLQDNKKERIVWIDMEMTGLDADKDRILEIACLVTSGQLDVIAEGPNLIIHQPPEVMDAMNDWCKQHHGQSGLTKAVLESKISTEEAEQQLLEFLQQHTEPGCAPLGGNSVHMDKMFLMKYMPRAADHLLYRLIDVSTIKELCRRWYPDIKKQAPKKAESHRAVDDIKESLAELRFYRQHIFKGTGEMLQNGF